MSYYVLIILNIFCLQYLFPTTVAQTDAQCLMVVVLCTASDGHNVTTPTCSTTPRVPITWSTTGETTVALKTTTRPTTITLKITTSPTTVILETTARPT